MVKESLKESLKISWQNPGLWFLGFLSTLFFIPTNEFLFVFSFPLSLFFLYEFKLKEGFAGEKIPFFLILIIFLIFFCLIFISVFSEVFLINFIKRKKKEESLKEVGRESLKLTGKIFLLKIFVAFLLIFFWILSNIFLKKSDSFFVIFYIFVSLLSLVLLFLLRYLIFFFVVEKKKILLAIKDSFLVLKENFLKTIEMSFLLFLILFLYTFIFSIFFERGAFTYPLRVFNFFSIYLFGKTSFWPGIIFTALFIILLSIFSSGFIAVYQIASWLILFLKIREKSVEKV